MTDDPPGTSWWSTHAAGLVQVTIITIVAYVATRFTEPVGIGTTALGVGLGVIVGNVSPVAGSKYGAGAKWAGKHLLAVAVVLLGLRVTIGDVATLGTRAALVLFGAVASALFCAWAFGRLLGVPRPLAALVGVGTAICGVSAIAAVRRATGADEKDVTYAVAAITFLGSLGLVVLPLTHLLWHPFFLADFGIWAGATLHSVPQAVGAGFAGGGAASGSAATLLKLSRVVLLAPVAVLVALAFHRRGAVEHRGWRWVPVEVLGFLALFVIGSLVPLPASVLEPIVALDRLLLVMALSALGLQTRFADLAKAGHAPFVLAAVTWVIVLLGVALGLRFTA